MTTQRFPDMEARYRAMLEQAFGKIDISALELFRSLAMAHHVLSSLAERNISQYNLSIPKLRVLLWLKMLQHDDADAGPLPSQLSKFQGVTPNTMSALLNSLREAGLIEQINHPKDRRKRVIKITQAGSDILREMGPGHYEYLGELFSDLSEEERQILITLLKKIWVSVRGKMCEDDHRSPHHPVGE